jgi:hypothetical protein
MTLYGRLQSERRTRETTKEHALYRLALGSFDELAIDEVPKRDLHYALENLGVERVRERLHGRRDVRKLVQSLVSALALITLLPSIRGSGRNYMRAPGSDLSLLRSTGTMHLEDMVEQAIRQRMMGQGRGQHNARHIAGNSNATESLDENETGMYMVYLTTSHIPTRTVVGT